MGGRGRIGIRQKVLEEFYSEYAFKQNMDCFFGGIIIIGNFQPESIFQPADFFGEISFIRFIFLDELHGYWLFRKKCFLYCFMFVDLWDYYWDGGVDGLFSLTALSASYCLWPSDGSLQLFKYSFSV